MLAAGLEGIENAIDPGQPHRENMYNYSAQDIQDLGIALLPRHLDEAIQGFSQDLLAKVVFGEKMFNAFIDFKQAEWDSYHNTVSDWEIQRYLKLF